MAASARISRQAVFALAGMCVGLILLVAGTFLPWLTSGSVERNSFAADASVRTLLDVHGAAGAALRWWPAVVAVAAVAVALIALGVFRVAVPIAAVVALVAGTVSIAVLTRPAQGLVHPAHTGPIVTVAGCALTLVAIPAYLVQRDSRAARSLHRWLWEYSRKW